MGNIYESRKLVQYNLDGLEPLIQNMIDKLINESDDLWILLKYNDYDALEKYAPLNIDEKLDLIQFKPPYSQNTPFHIIPYMSEQPLSEEVTQIRIYPYDTEFNNEVMVTQNVIIEVITHYNNYPIKGGYRIEKIKGEVIKVLNNFNYENSAGVIGGFTFNNTNARTNYYSGGFIGTKMMIVGNIK